MSVGDGTTARPLAVPRGALGARERIAPREAAWLVAIPCAVLLVALVVALGPPLGRALFVHPLPEFWPYLVQGGSVFPEPTEHARFLLSLAGPLLLVAALLLAAGRVAHSGATRALAYASQALLLAAAIGCVVGQHVLTSIYVTYDPRAYFTWTTLVVGTLVALAACAVLQSGPLVARLRSLTRETRGRRIAALVAAALFTGVWLLPAINTEGSIGTTNLALYVNIPFWLDETFGVLNGRAPLADFYPQYSQLWPYLAAGAMSVLGATYTVYAAVMTVASGATMLAVYALLRRLVRRSLLALALFVPFVATSFFTEVGPLENRWGPVDSFSTFPMRYGGPYVLAWLVVRRLDGARRPPRVLILALAWLVAVNNLDFGVPALGATVAALLLLAGRPGWRLAGRFAAELALGLLIAGVVVSALTLIVAGSLPDTDLGRLLVFPRLYGVSGYANLPISPLIGLHLTIYATYVAAIAVAVVRVLEGREDRALSGALAWVGVFGLGSGAYFSGRSHPDVLISLFSPWALALALLAIVAVRSMLARGARLPTPGELAPLLGVGVALCSIGQIPRPWQEVQRIERSTPTPAFRPLAQERFIARRTHRGERIAILGPVGHRIAYDLGLDDAMPYATLESMPTLELFDAMLDRLRGEGVTKAFVVLVQTTTPDHLDAMHALGWRDVARSRDVIELERAG